MKEAAEQFDANLRPGDETLNDIELVPEPLSEALFLAWDVIVLSIRDCLFSSQGQDESLRQNIFSLMLH